LGLPNIETYTSLDEILNIVNNLNNEWSARRPKSYQIGHIVPNHFT
jgi:hypothetical protein